MDSSKLVVKFFAENPAVVTDRAAFVPVFHSWIQTHAVEDHLLIDVADYQHVKDGPGTVLVSHEANLYADHTDGRLGLSYWRKQPLSGSFADRVRFVLRAALQACARLEADTRLNGLRFRTDEAAFLINDRLHAPNNPETFATLRPELQKVLDSVFISPVQLEHRAAAKELFEVNIKSSGSNSIASLLKRLG